MEIGSKEWRALIAAGAKNFGLKLDDNITGQFATHARQLMRWTQKINLTAITDARQIGIKHFLDSLAPAHLIAPRAVLLDIGSGGGFPGIPLKILIPSLSVLLIDSSRKKVNFLKHVIRTLSLSGIEARHVRVEALARESRFANAFDIVISRALSDLTALAMRAWPLLARGGKVIALKGPAAQREVDALRDGFVPDAQAPAGGISRFLTTLESYKLPSTSLRRCIVVIQRCA